MADERPRRLALPKQPRASTAGLRDRDIRQTSAPQYGTSAHAALGIVEFPADEDITGKHEGEELAQMRSRRPTIARVERLEVKQDEDRERFAKLEIAVASIDGKLAVLPRVLDLLEGKQTAAAAAHATEHETKRRGMDGRTKVLIALLGVITTALVALGGATLGGCA